MEVLYAGVLQHIRVPIEAEANNDDADHVPAVVAFGAARVDGHDDAAEVWALVDAIGFEGLEGPQGVFADIAEFAFPKAKRSRAGRACSSAR
jgi:hypothetical protein